MPFDDLLQVQIYDKNVSDDLAQMLGVEMWKIRLIPREKGQYVRVTLELHIPGKKPYLIYDLTDRFIVKGEYVFGLQPVDGDKVDSSTKIRFYHRFSVFFTDEAGDVGNKRRGGFETRPNPFLNLGQPFSYNLPPLRGDGNIILKSFKPSNQDDDSKNSELVVVATLQDPPKLEK